MGHAERARTVMPRMAGHAAGPAREALRRGTYRPRLLGRLNEHDTAALAARVGLDDPRAAARGAPAATAQLRKQRRQLLRQLQRARAESVRRR